jgi:hypothetical protein
VRRVLLVPVSVLGCAALLSTAVLAGAVPPPAYVPPVDAGVVDGFRPPATRFGPGNRGLEYGTAAGTEVRAAGDGRVAFAGFVAGTRHVTVLHADGVRTSYSFLASISVVAGQRVHQGEVLGTTSGHLHLGARRGDAYFDPASLFGSGPVRVHLVPFDEPPGAGERGERSALSQLVGAAGGLVSNLGGAAGRVGGWLRDGGWQLVRTLDHYGGRFLPPASLLDAGLTMAQMWQRARSAVRRPCTARATAPSPPSGRRVALLVAGHGSGSGSSTVDQVRTAELGYEGADVVRFSYAGGRVPDPTDGFTHIASTPYEAADTQEDLYTAGERLADLVEEVVAAAPGAPVDLIAHSQGGVVARLALIELEERHGRAWLAAIGVVATLGTPHEGADLATAVHAAGSTRTGSRLLDLVGIATGDELDADAVAVDQLAETSDLVADLADHPVPDGITGVSIAARGDVVVPVPRTHAPGMTEVVVSETGPGAHSDLPGSDAATRELGLALAGLPPTCEELGEALVDQAVGEGISLVEDLAGAAGFLLAARADVRGA